MSNRRIFIRWPKDKDIEFRQAYYVETGEQIIGPCIESADGLYFMTGTYRGTEQNLTKLKQDRTITAKLEDIKSDVSWPVNWETKQIIEEL